MSHFFEQIDHTVRDVEWLSVLIGILIVVLIVTFITMNIIICISAISMKKSLKKIADSDQPKKKLPRHSN